ncbi:acetyl/propionyl/methylcrotonyl-CoA carboxylase subunit alpha [Bifidobacterium gallicum]|uniref:biotin carboxylase n=1 Tax=Bifidobacterium gallicum DSM 20093 = LMG 11596 TaxID=561180 RepID=D1NWX0_9BIFI|nr:biotin carboxylase N-terminal domain-containing protein [Bifidobacterium gallicum]EFA22101.1 Carbamoyl-phosphate synthase L chain, ATP binding domain protein [Bifidobacterium gallicum DSM 20093 = LMG 11596]KFI59031.1 acetyl-CoA carboxylase [Bifidobacterium gallicum DSM 20093 = LMG 11596]
MQRILIANRGEIAVRIIDACRTSGRTAIAVYAEPDANALFVRLADEAYALGGTTPAQSYLNIERIIAVAKAAHADAVHPGYGFLSENADFAQAVIDAGMVWIGPSPQAMRLLGSKVAARRLAALVGAPMAPGTTEPVHDVYEVVDFAQRHGMPIAIKAVYGGGGRGLKVVHTIDDIPEAFQQATDEALSAFGNGDCFVERFLARPRHVEVQILADHAGAVRAIGTRDCSLQRRNQKLIEEAPAPYLDAAIEQQLMQAAVNICKAADYTGVGTVEFLVDPDGTMSFMEVNTRIQVEHPVTEQTTGIDLGIAQLDLAEGAAVERVCAVMREGATRGTAMEFRINAEDPSRGFVPFPGVVESMRIPMGPGIRFDSGVTDGSGISEQFDSMLAKLIVWAPTRTQCINRARFALEQLHIEGVPTVKAFDELVLHSPAFTGIDDDGNTVPFNVYTRWIEEELLPSVSDPNDLASGAPGARSAADTMVEAWIELDGKRMKLGMPVQFTGFGATTATSATPPETPTEPAGAIHAPITGTLVRWLVADGESVHEGDALAVMEAMKMETTVTAPTDGMLHCQAQPGQSLAFDAVIGTVQ